MFLRRVEASNLWAEVLQQVHVNEGRKQRSDELVRLCQQDSASISHPQLEQMLWHALAVNAGLLPAQLDEQGLVRYEFLQVPWEYRNERCVVKGSDEVFRARRHWRTMQ